MRIRNGGDLPLPQAPTTEVGDAGGSNDLTPQPTMVPKDGAASATDAYAASGGADTVTAAIPPVAPPPDGRKALADALGGLMEAVGEKFGGEGPYQTSVSVQDALAVFRTARDALGSGALRVLRKTLGENYVLSPKVQSLLNPRVADRGPSDVSKRLMELGRDTGFAGFAPVADAFGQVNPVERYLLGDRVAIRLPSGKLTEAIAVRNGLSLGLEVEARSETGETMRQVLSWAEVLELNPIKIGQCLLNVPELGRVFCDGLDETGAMHGHLADGRALGLEELREVTHRFDPLFAEQMKADVHVPAALLAEARKPRPANQALGITRVAPGQDIQRVYVGGLETDGVMGLETDHVKVAFRTRERLLNQRGSEDGVVVGVLHVPGEGGAKPREYAYQCVIDEAGGEAHVEGQTGAATIAVAQALAESLALLKKGIPVKQMLKDLPSRADSAVADLAPFGERGPRAVFTMVIVENGAKAYGVSVGDTQAMLATSKGVDLWTARDNQFDEESQKSGDPNRGVLKVNMVTRMLGSLEIEEAVPFEWDLEPGDGIYNCSDGYLGVAEEGQKAAYRVLSTMRREALPHGAEWRRTAVEVAQDLLGEVHVAAASPEAAIDTLEHLTREFNEVGRANDDDWTASTIWRK